MISIRAQRASTPALAPSLHQSCRPTAFKTTGLAPARQMKQRGLALAATGPRIDASNPRTPKSTTTSVSGVRHGSSWVGRRGTQSKYSWHRPGCTWVSSKSDPKTTARGKDCPACQEEESGPFEYSSRELMFQRHQEQMDALRRRIERDPYDALFGWSNKTMGSLWNRPAFSRMTRDIDSLFLGRALHSDATHQAPASPKSRKIPIQTNEIETKSVPAGNPNVQASMSWRTYSTDASGRTHEESGDLVYDPISNRMVPRDDWFDKASPTAIGKGVHAESAGEGDTSDMKYARPSTDMPAEAASSESVPPHLKSKVEQIKQKEAKIEIAKEQARSAVGVEEDAKQAGWTERQATPTPGYAADEMPANSRGVRMSEIAYQNEHMKDKYVTPSEDPVKSPSESVSSGHEDAVARMQQREAELEQAKKAASSDVGVEEDAQRAGWTNKDLKPERPVSPTPYNSIHGWSPRLEPSLDRHIAKTNNSRIEKSARAGTPVEEEMSAAESLAMHRIKAKERELDAMRRKLDVFKAKHDMEQSWRRETSSSSATKGEGVSQGQVDHRLGTPSPETPSNAWSKFKSGSELGSSSVHAHTHSAYSQSPIDSPVSSGIKQSAASRLAPSPETLAARAKADRGQHPSKPSASADTGEANKRTSTLETRKPGLLLVTEYKNGKRLKCMNYRELVEHKARLTQLFKKHKNTSERESGAAVEKLQDEVAQQKAAMRAFEEKWRHRQVPSTTSSTTKDTSSVEKKSEPVEISAGEGDMSPKVVEFAGNGRWYKDKALHAKQPPSTTESNDKQLVNDIKSVYERAYGTIDLAHRQGEARDSDELNRPQSNSSHRRVGFAPTSSADNQRSPQRARSERSGTSVASPVNPIDGTTRPGPDVTPQIGNFASPTGFVNHDPPIDTDNVITSSNNTSQEIQDQGSDASAGSKRANTRSVRRDEPVFSGQIPAQGYSVPEVIEMLKQQGVAASPPADGSSGSKARPRPSASERNSRKQQSNTWGQSARYMMLGGGFGAAMCYAIGIMVEYAREPRVEGGYDRGRPTWDGQRSWRGRQSNTQSPRTQSPAGGTRGADGRDSSVHLSDLPLRGFEYPMMGALVACIWYILSSGGS